MLLFLKKNVADSSPFRQTDASPFSNLQAYLVPLKSQEANDL